MTQVRLSFVLAIAGHGLVLALLLLFAAKLPTPLSPRPKDTTEVLFAEAPEKTPSPSPQVPQSDARPPSPPPAKPATTDARPVLAPPTLPPLAPPARAVRDVPVEHPPEAKHASVNVRPKAIRKRPIPRPRPQTPPPFRQRAVNTSPPDQTAHGPVPVARPTAQAAPLAAPQPSPRPATLPNMPPAPKPAGSSEISPGYRAALGAWLIAHKTYPDSARERGEEGRLVLRFRLDRAGRVLDYAVIKTSGYADLDAAARDMMRGAVLPPFPKDMTQSEIEVSLTVRFGLSR